MNKHCVVSVSTYWTMSTRRIREDAPILLSFLTKFSCRSGRLLFTELGILVSSADAILRAVLIVSSLFDLPHLKGLWLI